MAAIVRSLASTRIQCAGQVDRGTFSPKFRKRTHPDGIEVDRVRGFHEFGLSKHLRTIATWVSAARLRSWGIQNMTV